LPDLLKTGAELRARHWRLQQDAGIDLIPSNDFSYYDRCSTPARWSAPCRSATAGRGSGRHRHVLRDGTPAYSRAGGRHSDGNEKWFDTTTLSRTRVRAGQAFRLSSSKPVDEFQEAKAAGHPHKPVLIGPVTFVLLGEGAHGAVLPLTLARRAAYRSMPRCCRRSPPRRDVRCS